MRITRAAAVIVLVLGFAGCSGSGDEEPDASPSPEKSPGQQKPKPGVQGGVEAPQSLNAFECEAGDGGRWRASGTIANDRSKAADYRVTIRVAPTGGGSGSAREITLAGIPADASETFRVRKLPVIEGDDPTCSVQVVRLDG